jgi:hypothetical protein
MACGELVSRRHHIRRPSAGRLGAHLLLQPPDLIPIPPPSLTPNLIPTTQYWIPILAATLHRKHSRR